MSNKKYKLGKKIKRLRVAKSNWLLSAILESSPDVIVFALDKKYCYLAFNRKHKDVIRTIWGKEIKIGMCMLDIFGDHEDRHKAKNGFDRALAGESFILTDEYGDEKLSRLYWQVYWSPIYSEVGDIIGLTCFCLDITVLKQAEESLKVAMKEKNLLLSELEKKNIILKGFSETDALTGLYNRRYIMERMKEEIERANRYSYAFSIIIFDVDCFKQINDNLGHLVGDNVLMKISSELKRQIRKVDIIGRYGGEEFILILPCVDDKSAFKVAEKLRESIHNLVWNDYSITTTLSGGIAGYAGESIDELIKKADYKLYQAKRNGRNRIEL